MPDATVVASPYKIQVEASEAPKERALEVRPIEIAAMRIADPRNIVEIAAATPMFQPPPEPHTLETRRDVATDAIGDAWFLVRHRLGPMTLGTLITALASSALAGTGVGLLALGPLQGGLAVVAVRAASGRSVELNDFFEGFSWWRKLVWSGLLVGLVVALGSVLILPGLYLATATAYTPLLIVDRGDSVWGAFKASLGAVNAQIGAHLAVALALLGINVLGALACGAGLLVTIPLSCVTVGVCYGRVFGFTGGVDRV